MRSVISSLGLMGVLLGLAMPVSAEVLLQAGATEAKLVTAESYRPWRHQLTAEAGQTIAIRLKLANNNPDIVSRVAVYEAGKSTPLNVDNQVSYRIVDPAQKSQISHLIVLTLPGDSAHYEIEPLFDYDTSPEFGLETTATATTAMPSTVRYRMTVETATVSQKLLLEAQEQQTQEDFEAAVTLYSRAINLNPDIADFYAQRGRAYLALSETSTAPPTVQQAMVTDWETAVQLYEQVGHDTAANALRSQLHQFVPQGE